MITMRYRTARLGWLILAVAWAPALAAEQAVRHIPDVIYGRKHGMALTMEVFQPQPRANGAAVVFVVSGGWVSHHAMIDRKFYDQFLKRGYTVFAVLHGSQPMFTIPEAVHDLHRAVRFIRHHADRYGIDPERIGVTGGSAGGHLSLMVGTGGASNDKPGDPYDQVSSRVQAVACFFPPTDFLNYGQTGNVQLGEGELADFRAPFDFRRFDTASKRMVLITDEQERRRIGREISPVYHITAESAPTLIIHGDADLLVPIQQAELMIDGLKRAGVEAELVNRPGADHGWPTMIDDVAVLADWFDRHLKPEPEPTE